MNEEKLLEIKTEYSKSGVKPFERNLKKAYNLASNEVCSVYSSLKANSFIGVLEQDVYSYPIDKTETWAELLSYHVSNFCRNYLEQKEQEGQFCETWVYGSPSFLKESDKVKDIITSVLAKYGLEEIKPKICLAFSKSILWLEKEVLGNVKSLKEFGVKIAVMDIGERFCPITVLSEIKADYVVLSNELNFSEDDEAKKSIVALVEYLKTNGYTVYAECKEEERALYRKFGVNACWSV